MKRFLAGLIALWALALGAAQAMAETPQNVLVMALQFDDIITLDPAEVFEFSGAEYAANVYDRLVTFDARDFSTIVGGVAESWTISEDGKTFTFKIREGLRFHSGNPVTAFDVAYSLRRVVLLNKSPAFILTQFGFTPDNVRQRIRAPGAEILILETDRAYAPSFLLNCLTAGVGSVLDSELLKSREKDGDMGHGWLRTNSAGSGPFRLSAWRPNELLILEGFDDYWQGPPAMERVIIRHIAEPATQRLLLEKGDIDIARNLGPEQIAGLEDNPEIVFLSSPKGALYYMGLNQKNPYLARPEVREALKYLVDYEAIAKTIMKGRGLVHQTLVPGGFLGALEETPYGFDLARAKDLLAAAGLAEGFAVTMDARNTPPTIEIAQVLQASFALAGIALEIVPGDGKQTLTKYRARNHDIYIGLWGPDYQDPHSNAEAFARNPDNSDGAAFKSLAWRNGWEAPELGRMVEAAVVEADAAKRAALYQEIQRIHQREAPFVIMFQTVDVAALRRNVTGFVSGPSFDTVSYRNVTK